MPMDQPSKGNGGDNNVGVEDKVDYMNLPSPIPYEELNREALSCLKPGHFEGLCFNFTKRINDKLFSTNNLMVGARSVEVPETIIKVPFSHYDFGATIIYPKLMLTGRLTPGGGLDARTKCDLTNNLTLGGIAMLMTEESISHGIFSLDYKGKDYRTQFQVGNNASFSANYIQRVTRCLTLGGNIILDYQNKISEVGYGARYSTNKMVATAQVDTNRTVGLSFFQKITQRLSLAALFMYNYKTRDATASVGYDYELPQSRIRGKIDSNGCAAVYVEDQLNVGLKIIISAEIDHRKKDYKLGVGVTVAQ